MEQEILYRKKFHKSHCDTGYIDILTNPHFRNFARKAGLASLYKCDIVFQWKLLKASGFYTVHTVVVNHTDSNLPIPEKLPISAKRVCVCVRACVRAATFIKRNIVTIVGIPGVGLMVWKVG